MYPTPQKGAMDARATETPSSEQRRRGRQRNVTPARSELLTPLSSMASAAPSPSPARRRGCNCKKSGCLKLYCECFAGGVRCGDRCQCLGCKNREHNKLEIAHAMETIEKRSQRSFKSPVAVARKLGTLRASTPQGHASLHTPGRTDHGLTTPVMDGATRLLMSAERLEETPRASSQRTGTECICTDGACHVACPCHEYYGGCSHKCACHLQVPATQEKKREKIREKNQEKIREKNLEKNPERNPERGRGCSCKKSNCLKLYCECLAAQRLCDSRCNCAGCKNHPEHTHERERAIAAILERNPMAFEPKVASGAAQHQRGCNCRKSNCMKNYCECHQAGVPCTGRCACQDCRNTDAFVSAKKMLIFSGDLKIRGRNTSPDGRHSHTVTPSSSKPPRRPSRRVSMDQTSPPSQFRTPTTDSSAVLGMLSRTAPPASQHDSYSFVGGQHSRVQAHVKRKQSDEADNLDDSSAEGKRKFAKSLSSRPNFQERLERAASSGTVRLPSVESVLEGELDASQPELPLSKLCRSLLNAAGCVDVTPTPRKMDRSPAIVRRSTPGYVDEDMADVEQKGPVSPTTDDLLCEENIETPTRGTPGSRGESANNTRRSADAEDKQRVSEVRLAALQERAVLQEFSVWLRNLATSAAPLQPPQ